MLTQEERARLYLDHPENYPSLERWDNFDLVFRVWRYPSLETYTSQLLREKDGEFRVRRLEWDRSGFRAVEPTIYGSEAVAPPEQIKPLIQRLRGMTLPPFAKPLYVGIDGVICGVESKSYFSNGRLSWWSSPPEGWMPLREWFDETVKTFDALLPESTARMRGR